MRHLFCSKCSLLFFLFLITFSMYGETSLDAVVIMYSRSEYKAKSQNWSIVTDTVGRIYFGNNDGLLEYDGFAWKKHEHPTAINIRSLYYDDVNGRIYAGYYEEFGYWKRDVFGTLQYTSLTDKIGFEKLSGNSIWSIVKKDSIVYFQTFGAVYNYNELSENGCYMPSENGVLLLGKADDKVLAKCNSRGVVEINNDSIRVINDDRQISQSTLRFYLNHEEGVIIGSAEEGLLLLQNNDIREWNLASNKILSTKNLNCGIQLRDGGYAIGTLSDGLYILDENGKIVHHINQRNGLDNNTILSMKSDGQGNIWLGLDNGIAHVIINSAIHYKINKKEVPYSIYSVIENEGYCYLATNTGLLYAKAQSADKLDFKQLQLMPGIPGHIWKLEFVEGELLCGNNKGLYAIRNNKAIRLSGRSGVTDFALMNHHKEKVLIASTYNDLELYQLINDKWQYAHTIKGFRNTCRQIEIDNAGFIWLSHEVKGLTQLNLNSSLTEVQSSKFYGIDGVSSEYNINIFKTRNRIVITTSEGIYTYDYLKNKIVPYYRLNKALEHWGKVSNLVNVDNSHFWVVGERRIALVKSDIESIHVERNYTINEHFSFTDKHQSLSKGNEKIYFCLDNGFATINNDFLQAKTKDELFFSRIEVKQSNREVPLLLPLRAKELCRLKTNQNNLVFEFNNVLSVHKPLFQYKLLPIDEEWVEVEGTNILNFDQLEPNTYTLLVRIVDASGKSLDPIEYHFSIIPLWQSFIYIPIAVVALFVLLVVLFTITYKKKTKKITKIHEGQLEKSELKVRSLKEEIQNKELENLETQLTISTNELLKRDDAINSIKDELSKTYKSLNGRFPQKDYKNIIATIEEQLAKGEKDRSDFEQHFMASQSGFYEKLKADFPNLTSTDLRLCSLLKMNLNSKEIASYLNITYRSVEVSRYRLRKKLNLSSDDGLVGFLVKY